MTEPRSGASDSGIFGEDESDVAENAEFDRTLAAGTEALQRGDAAEARITLEKALRHKPRNQRARNLLGLSLFKLGELDRAEEIYRTLIEDHPADPTLRVNLGLVYLKASSSAEAVRCFETALDLSPDHQKAQNYLGLALAQKGELARAKDWFVRAGNAAMAERMSHALQSSPIRQVAQVAEEAIAQERPFKSALDAEPRTLEMARPPVAGWVATPPGTAAAAPVAPKSNAPAPDEPPATTPAEAVAEATSGLAQYTSSTQLNVRPGGGGFTIGASEVVIQVKGDMLTRLDGLVASWGSVTMKPELKRFRGKATDKPFGDGARRMLRASGEGRYVIAREGRQFTALELGDEAAYFREEVLFAFEESLLFENGRVPSRTGSDLHLVHLRGNGKLLLVTQGAPRGVEVKRGEALRIPMDQLVGWHGPLIQPRLVPIVEEAPDLGMALELAGEGRALLDAR